MAKNRDLLAIGHSAHDYIIRVPEFPKANFSAPITNMKTFNGGAAANVACVGAKLGLKTSLVSAVGGDFKKTEYYENMQNLGIDRRKPSKTPKRSTWQQEILNSTGDVHRKQKIRTCSFHSIPAKTLECMIPKSCVT